MMPTLILNLAGFAAVATLLARYWSEKQILSAFARSSLPPGANPLATAFDLAGLIHVRIPRGTDPPFIPIEAFDIVGATPVSILRCGGCCSGLSRLYITALGTLGVKATQVTLYHAAGHAQHCLAEVSLGEQCVLVDPVYGFYYVDGHGEHVSLAALRRGVEPLYRPLPHSAEMRYPANDYYNFAFARTKTANWTKTWIRRVVYRVLRGLTGGRIDTLRQRLWMEWPQLVVAAAVTVGILLLDLVGALLI